MPKKYMLGIVMLIFLIIAFVSFTIIEYRNNVKWLESFQPPAETKLIQFRNITQTLENKNCYPGTCYQVEGVVVNSDTKSHTFQFVVDFYAGDRYVAQSGVVSINNLDSGQSEQFKANLRGIFAGGDKLEPIPKIFSFNSETFDTLLRCVRKISWFSRSEFCRSGF